MLGTTAPKFPCTAGKRMGAQRMASCPAPGKSWSQGCCCPSDFSKQLPDLLANMGAEHSEAIVQPHLLTNQPSLQRSVHDCHYSPATSPGAQSSEHQHHCFDSLLVCLSTENFFQQKISFNKKEIRMTFLLHFIPLTHGEKIIIAMSGERQRDVGAPEFTLPWCVDTSFQLTLTMNELDITEQWM